MRNAPKTFLLCFAALILGTTQSMALAPDPPPPTPPPPPGLPLDSNIFFLVIAAIGLATYKYYSFRKNKITRA